MKTPTLLKIIASIKPVCVESASDLVVSGTPWSFILRDNYRNSGFESTPIKLKKIKKGHKENMIKQEGMSWKFSITGCPLNVSYISVIHMALVWLN
ncbi:unnamed protein product [Staurois parvus]|uniref:Uncharacterized protein n=1 Tax=Staurois parvus TaxID=386267 RepID=A0ABN9GYC3_9NEOB|nr:unnamed protein product [Staurois parvus]